MGIVGPVVRTVGSLSHTVRDVGRLRQVAMVLTRHGLGLLVAGLPGVNAERAYSSTPDRAVSAIQELGPTFIKLGQVLSTRADVIPPAYIEALQALQDDVDALPWADLEAVLREELGPDWSERLGEVDHTPLATASIAQVHRAVTTDGRRIVLKIQRPGIAPQIRSDLNILQFIVNRAIVEFPEFALFDPRGILAEFERSILAELDFVEEVRHLKRFRRNFAENPAVVFPEPIDPLCTRRVLTMSFIDGVKIRDARASGYEMDDVGKRALDVMYTMLFTHGFFHGDLHPGNLLVAPGGVIAVLDCGMVGRLTDDMKDWIAALLFAVFRGDHRTIARLFFDIAIKEGRVDYDAFERDSIEVMEKHWSGGNISEMHIGAFLMDITRGALRHRVRAPPAFTMFFKAILTAEGLAKTVVPEVEPIGAAQPHVDRLMRERWGPERFTEDWSYRAITLSALLKRLPVSLSQLLDDVDQQRLQINVSHVEWRAEARAADRRTNRSIMAAFACVSALCGTLAIEHQPPRLLHLPTVSIVFYGISLALFLYTGRQMLGHRRGL